MGDHDFTETTTLRSQYGKILFSQGSIYQSRPGLLLNPSNFQIYPPEIPSSSQPLMFFLYLITLVDYHTQVIMYFSSCNISRVSCLYFLLSSQNISPTIFEPTCDIFKSSTWYTILHCLPSIYLLTTHQSYGLISNSKSSVSFCVRYQQNNMAVWIVPHSKLLSLTNINNFLLTFCGFLVYNFGFNLFNRSVMTPSNILCTNISMLNWINDPVILSVATYHSSITSTMYYEISASVVVVGDEV